jgi:endonuclease/exonuclease/phosphatase family metal-dependent hydrolase
VSWNTHAAAGRVHELVARLRAGDLTGGQSVTHFVLLLQEAVRTLDAPNTASNDPAPPGAESGPSWPAEHEVQRLSAALGVAAVYAPAMRHRSAAQDRGNAILSTVPLRDLSVVELPFERQRRLAVVATASGHTRHGLPWHVRVASAHFDTGLMIDRGGSEAARLRQADALVDVLSPWPGPLVVGGDFNTEWRREPAVALLTRAFPDARQTDDDTWRGPLGLRRRLDHLFARLRSGTAVVSRVADRMGSDHHALLTTIPTAVLTDEVQSSTADASTPFAVDGPWRTQPQGGAPGRTHEHSTARQTDGLERCDCGGLHSHSRAR